MEIKINSLDNIHEAAKKITEQQIAKRKKYQKTSGENRKKKRGNSLCRQQRKSRH